MGKEFDINIENNQIRFTKKDYSFANGKGPPIVGWISKKRIGTWLNYLRDLNIDDKVFPVHERPKINEKHITLYLDDRIIGWVEKDCRFEVIELLWKYLKENGGAANNQNKNNFKAESDGQLKMF